MLNFCIHLLGIDPSRITVDEETDGGWTAKGQISPPSTPKILLKTEKINNDEANHNQQHNNQHSSFGDKMIKVNEDGEYFNEVMIEKEQ